MLKSENGKKALLPLAGGLGNQLFQYAFFISREKSNLVLESSLALPRLNSLNLPELTSLEGVEGILFKATFGRTRNEILRRVLSVLIRVNLGNRKILNSLKSLVTHLSTITLIVISCGKLNRFVISENLGFVPDKEIRSRDVLFGYFQTYRYADEEQCKAKLMELKPKACTDKFDSQKRIAKEIKPIVLHMRFTDYEKEINFGSLGEEYYSIALQYIFSRGIKGELWVFSDEPIKAELKLRKLQTLDGISKIVFIDPQDFDSSETWELMRYGSAYVIANSSFSWWSAFLRHDQSAEVICPKPWFRGIEEPRDLIPPRWIRIHANFERKF